MDKVKLTYFISAARHLNFTKAAEDCHVVQGTISKQISALEEELGIKLFIRKGQTLALSPAGQRLFDDAGDYLDQYSAIESSLRKLHLVYDDKLRVAVGTMEHPLAISAFRRFYENYPNIDVQFYTYTYGRMASNFRSNVLDIGFCCDLCANTIHEVARIPLHDEEWMVAAASDSPFWALPEEDQANFTGQTIVSVQGNEYDPVYRHFLENNYKIKTFSFTNAMITILTTVQSGGGIAILPSYIKDTVVGLRMEKMKKTPLTTPFSLIYNPNSTRFSTIERFLEYYNRK